MKTVAKSTDLKSGGIACGSSLQASDVGTDDGRVGIASSSSKGKRFLYLFSGPKDRSDSFGNYAKKLGIECDEYDTVNGKQYDLVSDTVWSSVLQDVKMGKYDGVLMAPPCNTYTNARKADDGGPKPLRGPKAPELYGLSSLREEDKEKVRVGTLLAVRTAELARVCAELEIPCIIEQPLWKKEDSEAISMYNLEEFAELLKDPQVQQQDVSQCQYGAKTQKPSTLLLIHVKPFKWQHGCNHAKRSWTKPSTGEKLWSSHPPLKGKEWYIPSEDWRPDMLMSPEAIRERDRGLPYLTGQAQAYPAELNLCLAQALAQSCRSMIPYKPEFQVVGKWKNVLKRKDAGSTPPPASTRHRVEFTAALRGRSRLPLDRDDKNEQYWGGMRNPSKIVKEVPGYRETGIIVYKRLQHTLDSDPSLVAACLSAIGSQDPNAGPPETAITKLRQDLINDLLPGNSNELKQSLGTKLDAGLLWAMGRKMGDPDTDTIYHWLTEGAPAGIEVPITDEGNIFPPDNGGDSTDSQVELPDPLAHANYSSVDGDEAAVPEVTRLINTGFVKSFDDLLKFKQWLGGEPHLSKLGMITKLKDGKTKRRLILDCKESGVNRKAEKSNRLILPRITDVVDDALFLMHKCDKGKNETTEWFILDFTDWFFNVPLHPNERKHFTLSFQGTYVAYLTQAQGSVNAPLICGRVAALVARLTQGVFGDQVYRLQLYVDDPCIAVAGSKAQRDKLIAATILLWTTLGIRLAFKKAARGTEVTWIGGTLTMQRQGNKEARLIVRAKQEIVEEVKNKTQEHFQTNVVPKKELLSYVGKLNHIAGIVEFLRPFMTDLYGVIHSTNNTSAPKNCFWAKQWQHVTTWLLAFFRNEAETIQRVYRVQTYFGHGLQIRMVTDASPWGLGGYLLVNTTPLAYFTSAITELDEQILGVEVGRPEGQQVLEALAVLVALKLWRKYWQQNGVHLHIRSDSVSTLTLLVKLRAKVSSPGMGLIARELALEFGSCSYKPRQYSHIPGVANNWADVLSRIHQPGKQMSIPAPLRHCRQEECPIRDQSFYLNLSAAKQDSNLGAEHRT